MQQRQDKRQSQNIDKGEGEDREYGVVVKFWRGHARRALTSIVVMRLVIRHHHNRRLNEKNTRYLLTVGDKSLLILVKIII